MPRISAGAIDINYEIFGEGNPLLLIMGFAMPGTAWVPILPLLIPFKCIYFDNRGTGNSDKPEGPYSIEQMADDASHLLEALGVSKAAVFGVSMGGMIAQELAIRHPEQVEKLVLGCTMAGGPSARFPAPEVIGELMEATRMMASDPERALDTLLPLLFPESFINAHPETKQVIMAGLAMMPRTPPETADRMAAGMMAFNTFDRLERINCPVLIVHGDADILVPGENAHIMKSRLPQAELYVIPGAGHAFFAADPIAIQKRISGFLRA
jgi:pimeloyl-ACP methyl ester carboxylesterase